MPPGKKPQPRPQESFPPAAACQRPGCPNRARYEITDDGQEWRKVCSRHFLHWNGTLPLPATLAQPRS